MYENVVVNKSVTLKGVGNPFVDAGEKRNAITLSADGITLEGLTAISGSSWWEVGIKVISSNNSITGNNISNNDDGIYFNSTNNKIFLNNFINSINSAYSCNSTNIWNSTEKITYTYNGSTYTNYLGNYWHDYEEKYPDADAIDTTGIWDTPYILKRDMDIYPLMERFENYIISKRM